MNCLAVYAETKSFFTPSSDCENQIIHHINIAQKKVDVAIYSLTHWRIAQSLQQAKQRNVAVRILADKRQAGIRRSKVFSLFLAGVNVRVHSYKQKQHNKFAIFDGKTVVTGSYNWTLTASNHNTENCIFIYNEPKTIQDYQNYFEYLWEKNSDNNSTNWFNLQLEKGRENDI